MFDYAKYQKEQVKAIGFDPDKLTQNQIELMLEPSEAPENFHCDGEITPAEAQRRWMDKLKKAGFTPLEVFNIKRKVLG